MHIYFVACIYLCRQPYVCTDIPTTHTIYNVCTCVRICVRKYIQNWVWRFALMWVLLFAYVYAVLCLRSGYVRVCHASVCVCAYAYVCVVSLYRDDGWDKKMSPNKRLPPHFHSSPTWLSTNGPTCLHHLCHKLLSPIWSAIKLARRVPCPEERVHFANYAYFM